MSSAKKGFLLPDALVSVFLVSVMVLLVSGAVQVHFHGDRIIEQRMQESDMQLEEKLQGCMQCIVPEPDLS
ncbi:MAG: hypothetical protein IKD69_06945 [Solobacterium sp.]|nr:hypothetical protein [Solobacterium sp.]